MQKENPNKKGEKLQENGWCKSQPFFCSIDINARKEYNYVYEDGVIVRSTECNVTVDGENVDDRSPVCTVLYTYNGSTLVKKRIINHEDGAEQVYTYPKDNGNTASCTFVRGDTTVTATSVTDGLGRAVSESIATGSGTISRSFTYTEGDSEPVDPPLSTEEYKPTTQLVSKIELSDGTVLDYEYDACGRITKVTETRSGTATVTEYTYDALGQLLTEKVNGTAVNAMTYDSYGNVLTKNGVSYSYDSTWKDRLTSVGDHSVTYGSDPCNPATYFGNALVWEKGRQLKQFGNYTYKYNANGIRTDKWENGVQHVYTLDGAKILREELVVGETDGNSVIVPIYDTNESVIGLTRSDITGQVTYYFLKNLQGDIIAITDASGTVIARYTYDAWGKVLSVTDANGNSITSPFDIANVNPFRYRGYYYDTETWLYYLQSRYYDPEVGRFINADEAVVSCVLNKTIIDYNHFNYCSNNAVSHHDPFGYSSGYIDNQNDFSQSSLKFPFGLSTVGEMGCGAVAAYNVCRYFSKKISFNQVWNEIMHVGCMSTSLNFSNLLGSTVVKAILPILNFVNMLGPAGVMVTNIIEFLKGKFFYVKSAFLITNLWGIIAEMSKAIIIAYWRPQYSSGHYIAGISTNNDGVGGRFNFYNNEDGFFDCNDEKSVWQYVDALKKKGYIPLCIIGVNLKKGWW